MSLLPSLANAFAPNDHVDEPALAIVFRRSTRTIRRWVADGTLPPPDMALKRLKLWRWGNVVDHINAGPCSNTGEAA